MSSEIKAAFGLTTAYFFNSDLAGNMYFAQTDYQHSVNQQRAEQVNERVLAGTYAGNEKLYEEM